MEVSNNWKEVKLGELLTDEQCVAVGKLLAAKDGQRLREYLEGLNGQLSAKGVLPAYLFYVLANEYNL